MIILFLTYTKSKSSGMAVDSHITFLFTIAVLREIFREMWANSEIAPNDSYLKSIIVCERWGFLPEY